ncbi:MAG TPA: DUF1194 domain-containing protein [Enterovirga sp.]
MRRFTLRVFLAAAFGLVAGLVWRAAPAQAESEVDLALVLAVDISFSMDPDEQTLQREGFIEAFRSSVVQDAIRRGVIGRIAVTYMEWAGSGDQRVVVPWALIDTPESAAAFAEALAARPARRAARTSISGAIDFAVKLLAESSFATNRQVIDVSGDGPNNQGRPVLAARADAIARGITINGLPIMLKAPGYFDIADLDIYYRDCVIGGQGAFMVPARERDQFRDAVKTKIMLEVAGLSGTKMKEAAPAGSLVEPAQAEDKQGSCLAGEMQWRDRMGN